MVEYDMFGPEKILDVYDTKTGMRGILVIDSTVLGPGKGGIRMTHSVHKEEVFRLARAMTWKNSLAELPFGGGKSGIIADSKNLSRERKNELIRAFSRALKEICPKIYVAGPDMYMAEEDMAVFAKANGDIKSCTGKPKSLGGLPHELGSTGFGVYHAVKVAAEFIDLDLKDARVAIEGFGNVGSFVANFLNKENAKLVAISDSKGCLHNKDGIDLKKLIKVKKETGSVIHYKPGKVGFCEDIIGSDVDILVTAAVPDLIKADDIYKIKAKLIVEGSNIPIKAEVEEMLYKKKVLVVPDFVANSGGVISSYIEYKNGSEKRMFRVVEEKIKRNTKIVLERAKKRCLNPRDAALEIAKERILKRKK